ncbi:MAG: diguanylate cyclase, partial [Gammaproteobacteria bacterium]|nr:diguanylate cyclase [Gammaproteobacteria bacterium]
MQSIQSKRQVVAELDALQAKKVLTDKISRNRLDIFRNIELFLLDPTIGYYDRITYRLIDDSKKSNQQLISLVQYDQDHHKQSAEAVKQNLNQLQQNVTELFGTRLNINKQFPGLALATNEMTGPEKAASSYLEILIDEIISGELVPETEDLLPLLLNTERLWRNQVNQYRIYLSNRFATFSTDFLQIQAKNISRINALFSDHISQLEAIYAIEDSFEGADNLQIVKQNVVRWFDIFTQVRALHESENWRTDNLILKQNIIPIIEKLSSHLIGLESSFIQQEKAINIELQANIERLFLLLATIITLFLLFIITLLFSLEHTVFGPVKQVSQALKAKAFNLPGPKINKATSSEINTLIDAFQEMTDQVHQREKEVNKLFAWQQAVLDSSAYSIISTDTEGTIATFNQAASILLGYEPEEVIGKVTPAVIHDPEEVEAYARVLSEALGEPIEPGFDVFVAKSRRGLVDAREWQYIRKDGTRFPIYLTVTAIRDAQDQIIGYLGTGFDLTERKAAEAYLKESESRYKSLFESANDAIVLLNQSAEIIDCNPATLNLLGCEREQIIHHSLEDFSPLHQPDDLLSKIKIGEKIHTALSGENQSFEWRLQRFDDTAIDAEISLNAVKIINKSHCLGTVRDITERKELQAQLEFQAGHDSLTGLPNRKTLHEVFSSYQQVADATSGHVAMLLLDLDRFKEINDTLGHHYGDKLLSEVGPRLEQVTAGLSATIARLGGDEFAVLVESSDPIGEQNALASRFLQALRKPFEISGIKTSISASIGLSVYPEHGKDSHELLRAADVAMYDAKKHALGVKIYEPDIDDYSKQRLSFGTELTEAVKKQQLVLHYQPKIDIFTREITGFEALVRWQHPELGLVYPNSFIDLVEMSEVIHPFTEAVIDLAVKDKKELHAQGFKQPVAINLSARNLLDDSCYQALESTLAS